MKSNRVSRFENSNEGYFDDLPATVQTIVRGLILDAANERNGPDGWKPDEEAIEEIECRSRAGFMPFAHNRGGIEYKNFSTLMDYWGGGYTVAHEKAAVEIERQIDYSFEMLAESIYDQHKAILEPLGLTKADCNYHRMSELENKHPELSDVRRDIEEGEHAQLSGDNSSIMHSIRFMYHGKAGGVHSASISAAVNTEGPYHRSSISWAPGVFCEGAKEVEITWKTQAELKRKLKAALSKVSKAVF